MLAPARLLVNHLPQPTQPWQICPVALSGGCQRASTLSPWAQSQVFALCTVPDKKGIFLLDGEIALEVYKVGGGHPSKQAMRKLREQFEADPAWCAGKLSEGAGQPGEAHSHNSCPGGSIGQVCYGPELERDSAHCWLSHCPMPEGQPQP